MLSPPTVDVDDLRYSVYENFFYEMDKKDPDYEASDYLEDYQAFSDALSQHNISADKNASQLTLEELKSIP